MQELFLRRAEAAEYLQKNYGFGTHKTLGKLATIGGGPLYRIAGRIPLYVKADLDTWALSKISGPVKSTSDYRSRDVAA